MRLPDAQLTGASPTLLHGRRRRLPRPGHAFEHRPFAGPCFFFHFPYSLSHLTSMNRSVQFGLSRFGGRDFDVQRESLFARTLLFTPILLVSSGRKRLVPRPRVPGRVPVPQAQATVRGYSSLPFLMGGEYLYCVLSQSYRFSGI